VSYSDTGNHEVTAGGLSNLPPNDSQSSILPFVLKTTVKHLLARAIRKDIYPGTVPFDDGRGGPPSNY
jgi:hypothetical protein